MPGETVILEVTGSYSSGLGVYTPGQVLHLTPEQARSHLSDSEGSFAILATTVEGFTRVEKDGNVERRVPVEPVTLDEINGMDFTPAEAKAAASGAEEEAPDEASEGDEPKATEPEATEKETPEEEEKSGPFGRGKRSRKSRPPQASDE